MSPSTGSTPGVDRQPRRGHRRLGFATPRRSGSPARPTCARSPRASPTDDHHALSPADVCPDNNLLAGRRLPAHRLRVVRGPPPRLGRGLPRRPLADLLVLVADPRRDGRAGPRRLPRGGGRGDPVRRHRCVPGRRRAAARACWALVSVSWSLTTALREEQTPHPREPRHPAADAAPPRSGRGVRHGRSRVRRRGARAHPPAVGRSRARARPGVPLTSAE